MSFESILRTDLIDQELLEVKKVRIYKEQAEFLYGNFLKAAARPEPTKTPEHAKEVTEVFELIEIAIRDYEKRLHSSNDAKIDFVYENPDTDLVLETISIELTKREPGMWGQGRPFENEVKQHRPILREELEDVENPGYRRAVLGYFYDNIITLTCWARTNKAANDRALWLENVMEEYTWFFGYSGVNRILYSGRSQEKVREVSNNKIYGRPIQYFVRTEKLRTISQKELEEICIRLKVQAG